LVENNIATNNPKSPVVVPEKLSGNLTDDCLVNR
jgi:hypothetical protein